MAIERHTLHLDTQDLKALAQREAKARGIHVTAAGIVRRLIKQYLLEEELACEVDLPPALGWGWLSGRVVWTRPHESAPTREGNTRFSYQSGFAFDDITPERQRKLAVALQILKASE